jgi:hypothetical protein
MREREENGIDREQSVVWQKVLTALWNEKITKDQIAGQLFMPSFEIENLLFGLANSQGGSQERLASTGPKFTLISR